MVLTLDEVARELRRARRSVERQITRRRIVAVHVGRSVRIERRELERYVEQLRDPRRRGEAAQAGEQTTASLDRGADGSWHARVTMGRRPDGTTEPKHLQRGTRAALREAVREVERARDTGRYVWTSDGLTLNAWLEQGSAARRGDADAALTCIGAGRTHTLLKAFPTELR